MSGYSDILREAADIAEERQKSYGEVIENLKETCAVAKQMFGLELSMTTAAKFLISLKVSRQKHQHKEDNILDTINYYAILLHVVRYQADAGIVRE